MFEKRSDLTKFLTVAETGKILAAADRLGITQPALSRVIAKLEDQFGGRLFERVPTGVRLTELGSVAADLARDVLREIEIAEVRIQDTVSGRTGCLRVTADPTWMYAVLPDTVGRFHEAYPGIEIELRTANASEGIRRLTHAESDIHCGGVDVQDPLPPFLACRGFLKVSSGIVAHKDHPLHHGPVALPDLANYPWIDYDGPVPGVSDRLNDRPSVTGVMDEFYRRTSKRVRTIVRTRATGLFMLGRGPYLSWLPLQFLASIREPELRPLPVELGRYSYRTGIVWRRAAEGLSPFRHLREILKQVASEHACPVTGAT